MPRRARKTASGRPPVEKLPELKIPGLEQWLSKPAAPKTDMTEEKALEAIRRSVLGHDPIGRKDAREKAAALGVHPHKIEMADLANVSEEREVRDGHDPWLR